MERAESTNVKVTRSDGEAQWVTGDAPSSLVTITYRTKGEAGKDNRIHYLSMTKQQLIAFQEFITEVNAEVHSE